MKTVTDDQKLLQLLTKLRERTLDESIGWQVGRGLDDATAPIRADLSRYSVMIDRSYRADLEDWVYQFELRDRDERVIDSTTDQDFPDGAMRARAWSLLGDIYKKARREAGGFEHAVDDLLAVLDAA